MIKLSEIMKLVIIIRRAQPPYLSTEHKTNQINILRNRKCMVIGLQDTH